VQSSAPLGTATEWGRHATQQMFMKNTGRNFSSESWTYMDCDMGSNLPLFDVFADCKDVVSKSINEVILGVLDELFGTLTLL
jgi:hypothetical protein